MPISMALKTLPHGTALRAVLMQAMTSPLVKQSRASLYPIMSSLTSFLRLPMLSYSYFCQYGAGSPTLGTAPLPLPTP